MDTAAQLNSNTALNTALGSEIDWLNYWSTHRYEIDPRFNPGRPPPRRQLHQLMRATKEAIPLAQAKLDDLTKDLAHVAQVLERPLTSDWGRPGIESPGARERAVHMINQANLHRERTKVAEELDLLTRALALMQRLASGPGVEEHTLMAWYVTSQTAELMCLGPAFSEHDDHKVDRNEFARILRNNPQVTPMTVLVAMVYVSRRMSILVDASNGLNPFETAPLRRKTLGWHEMLCVSVLLAGKFLESEHLHGYTYHLPNIAFQDILPNVNGAELEWLESFGWTTYVDLKDYTQLLVPWCKWLLNNRDRVLEMVQKPRLVSAPITPDFNPFGPYVHEAEAAADAQGVSLDEYHDGFSATAMEQGFEYSFHLLDFVFAPGTSTVVDDEVGRRMPVERKRERLNVVARTVHARKLGYATLRAYEDHMNALQTWDPVEEPAIVAPEPSDAVNEPESEPWKAYHLDEPAYRRLVIAARKRGYHEHQLWAYQDELRKTEPPTAIEPDRVDYPVPEDDDESFTSVVPELEDDSDDAESSESVASDNTVDDWPGDDVFYHPEPAVVKDDNQDHMHPDTALWEDGSHEVGFGRGMYPALDSRNLPSTTPEFRAARRRHQWLIDRLSWRRFYDDNPGMPAP